MKRVTILQSIPHPSVDVVLACGTPDRLLVGLAAVDGEPGSFAFVHIDRVTALALECGADLVTVLEERAQGPHFVATSDAIPDSL